MSEKVAEILSTIDVDPLVAYFALLHSEMDLKAAIQLVMNDSQVSDLL